MLQRPIPQINNDPANLSFAGEKNSGGQHNTFVRARFPDDNAAKEAAMRLVHGLISRGAELRQKRVNFGGTRSEELHRYFIAIVLLVVFKGICNMIADMKKHSAGFDIVQQIRERMIVKLKKFSLGFYTEQRDRKSVV